MDLATVVFFVIALSFIACIAVENVLRIVAKRTDFRFLLVGVLGAPVSGTIVSLAVSAHPEVFAPNVCMAFGIEALAILLAAAFLSYYLCALVCGFLRIHEERLESGKKEKVAARKKR